MRIPFSFSKSRVVKRNRQDLRSRNVTHKFLCRSWPSIDAGWNKHPPSTIDLWTWLSLQPAGSIVTKLIMGKDGLGVRAEQS